MAKGKPYRGNPLISCRMTESMLTRLQLMAEHDHTTASDIIRGLVGKELRRRGYQETTKQLDGQLTINDEWEVV